MTWWQESSCLAICLAVAFVITGCGDSTEEDDDEGEATGELCYEPTLDGSACDPESTTFTLGSTNPFYPLTVGLSVVLEGQEDGETIRIERTVLEETEMVGGVEVHVLEHLEYEDGELIEVARNFYVETMDGTVCYFGEDVENYEDGELANMDGSWRAGKGSAKPGIIMPANPGVGDSYLQENSPDDEAIDMGRVSELSATKTVGGASMTELLVVMDSNPFDDCDEEEEKLYAPGVGEVSDNGIDLIEMTQP